jgi:hypothetical protein
VVSWNAPSDGGSAITGYTVTPFIGATAQTPTTVTGSPPASSTTVGGLTNGTAYTFTVKATNAVGTGPASTPSNPVTPAAISCGACTIFAPSVSPAGPDEGDPSSTELGVKFTSDVNGVIKGIRFYKSAANTGTHIGNLWTASGTKLASATFTNETASGWQQVNFATPVSITANTVYVASYFAPAGHYAGDGSYFAASGVDNVPLHALKDGVSGGDGVYKYGTASGFPNLTFNSENYWVDVVFSTGPATAPAAPTGVTATAGAGSAQVSWTAPSDGGSPITSYTVTPFIGATAQTPTTVTGSPPAPSTTVSGLTNGTAYTFTVSATNAVGTGPVSAASNSVTPTAPTAPAAPTAVTATAGAGSAQVSWTAPSNGGSAITSYTVTPFIGTTAQTPTTVTGTPPATSTTVTGLNNGTAYTFTVSATNAIGTGPASAPSNAVTPSSTTCSACTIWAPSATPTAADEGDPSSVELGVKFRSDLNGVIKGIRFYKSAANTGTHIGNLWTASGTQLASATFSGETASGWQQVNVASYFAPAGHYAGDGGYFAASGVDNGPLHALQDGASGGDGVYAYGAASGFPNLTFNSENYWVDVVFSTGAATAPAAPTAVTATAGNASAQVTWTAPSDGGSAITSYTVTPFIGTTAQPPTTVTGSPPATTTTVTGLTNGTAYTFTVSATNAVGTGPASAPSSAVTPIGASAPGAPAIVSALAANAAAQVSWTAPADGGSAITKYTVTPFIGTTAQTPTTVTGTPPATSTTVTGLTNGTAYTFTVSATNAIGTGPASAASNSVTPSATTCGACTIWASSATPTTPSAADSGAVTLGVKFKADVSGRITGIRFYKGAGNTGTHVANLWSATGTKLATGTFTNETASGWQQVNFTTPVSVTAGTVYVASYFAPVGHYAADAGYFATAGVDNGLLHALKDGVSGGDGVYAYGSAAAFPSNTFLSTNYWVDVVYATP